MVIHGLIHLMGFAKAYQLGKNLPINAFISRSQGIAWLLACLLIIISAILLLKQTPYGWALTAVAAVLSQWLIMQVWKDAKIGTLVNLLMILVSVAGFFMHRFEGRFRQDAMRHFRASTPANSGLVLEQDLASLPPPVQRYLRYTGMVGKPRIRNLYIRFEGEMREKGKDWFPFRSEQYNFTKDPARLFFMKAKMFGMTVPGYHAYQDGRAGMDVKVFGLIPVVTHHEAFMFRTETVTYLNDICLFSPSALLDERITWESFTDSTARLRFQHQSVTVSANLHFDPNGALVNFDSDDRMAIQDMKTYRFSTPAGNYRDFHGFRLPSYGEAVWHYPDGAFTYGKFHVAEVRYNLEP